jgi:hypothetical protein
VERPGDRGHAFLRPMILAAGADLSSDGASRNQEPDASPNRIRSLVVAMAPW